MKRIRKKKLRRKANVRYSPRVRLSLVQYFLQERAKGVPARDIADKLGVSVATLYRWQADTVIYDESSICIPVATAIDILCDESFVEREALIAAVIALSVWMKWPTEPHYHDAASAALAVAYVCQTTDAATLRELNTSSRKLIEALVPLNMLWKSCTPQAFEFPIFGEFRIDGQPYTERNVIRDIAWYLLAHSSIEDRKRYKPSLNKALYLLHNNAFKYHWRVSRRTFDKFWKKAAPSAAFEFVTQDASHFNWSFDPADPFLWNYIDEIVDDRQGVIQYLSRCRWATEELARLLDPKVASQIEFPTFPAHLAPAAATVLEIPPSVIEKLQGFSAHATDLYDDSTP